jgi:hypothetical protein
MVFKLYRIKTKLIITHRYCRLRSSVSLSKICRYDSQYQMWHLYEHTLASKVFSSIFVWHILLLGRSFISMMHACKATAHSRVARWFIFKPKIPIWVNFGGPWIEKCWNIYGHWEYLMDIRGILWPFVTFFVHLVHFYRFWYHVPRKIWQPWPILGKLVGIKIVNICEGRCSQSCFKRSHKATMEEGVTFQFT